MTDRRAPLAKADPAIAQLIRREVERRCGIPGDHILLAASHNHSAPSLPRSAGVNAALGFERYTAALPDLIAGTVYGAHAHRHAFLARPRLR